MIQPSISSPEVPVASTSTRLTAFVLSRLPMGRFRLARLVSRCAPNPFWGQMPASVGKAWFRCNPRDHISRDVYFTGRYEPQETAILCALLNPGMTFVDVGANWGYFTLIGAHLVGRTGRVISLEPEPRLFRLLESNIARNAFTCVTAKQVAAAASQGEMAMAGFDENCDGWGLSYLTDDLQEGAIKVPTCSLDELLSDLEVDSVDLLKMDIEGAEDLALQGARDGLIKHRFRRILLEVHPELLQRRSRTVTDVLSQLSSAGYRGWEIDHSLQTTRRLSYARTLSASDLLQPALLSTRNQQWPHLLWLAPGFDRFPD